MAKKLLIIDESNKDIGRILNSEEPGQWIVTVGFVYGLVPISRFLLPSGELVEYETTEGQRRALDNIREHVKEDTDVYLATGPGLKGESHAWHLQRYLGLKNPKRVILHEISWAGIKAALAKARPINVQLVEAYEEYLSTQQHGERLRREYVSQLHPRDLASWQESLNCSAKEAAEFERKRIAHVEATIEMIDEWAEEMVYSLADTANQILKNPSLGTPGAPALDKRDRTSQSPSRSRARRVDLLRRPRPPCGRQQRRPQWLYASRSSAIADYAPALRSPWRAALEKQAMLKDLEKLAVDTSLWRKLVHGEPSKSVLTLSNRPKKTEGRAAL